MCDWVMVLLDCIKFYILVLVVWGKKGIYKKFLFSLVV